MTTYRWVGSHAYRDHANDRTIEPGEELPEDVAEQIASAHPHDVEEVDEQADDGDNVVRPPEEPPFDPTEKTVAEIEDELEDSEYTEAELLAVYSAEREAEDRTTAVEHIDDALDAVQE